MARWVIFKRRLRKIIAVAILLHGLTAVTANAGNAGLLDQARQCTGKTARLERLACFDSVFDTPVSMKRGPASQAPGHQPAEWVAAYGQETDRKPDDDALIASGSAGQIVTIAALGATPPRPLLTVRCDNNITHLALMLPEPLAAERAQLTLATDQRKSRQLWRVRDAGYVVSGGRGLPAIRTVKGFIGARRITLQSDQSVLDGLMFDLGNLRTVLRPLRDNCRW